MKKGLIVSAMVIIMALSLPLSSVYAIWNFNIPFDSSKFVFVSSESYYLNEMNSKVKVGDIYDFSGSELLFPLSGTGVNKNSNGVHLVFQYKETSGTWNAGEVLSLSMSFTANNTGGAAETTGKTSLNPEDYKISIINGAKALVFTASEVTWSSAGSSGYQNFNVTWLSSNNVESNFPLNKSKWIFDLPITENTSNAYDILFGRLNLSSEDSLENQNTQKVVDAVEKSTDEITNGWETDDNTAGDVDDKVNDMENAENEALGGKTDEEIMDDVNGAFDVEIDISNDGNIAVANTFNKLLSAFGAQYNGLLLLSLTLGTACFIIGRHTSSKGGGS